MSLRLFCLLLCLTTLTIARPVAADSSALPATPAAPDPSDAEDDDEPASGPAKPDPGAAKFWQALQLLDRKAAPDLPGGRTLLQEASDLEFSHAQVLLGNCYLSGSYGFPKQPRKAVNLFRLAAERGNAFAMVSLATCYVTATGIRRDDVVAESWLNSALAANADFSRPVPPESYLADIRTAGSVVAGELANDPLSSSQATAHFLLGQILTKKGKLPEAHAHYVAAATAGPDGRSGVYQAAVEAALNLAFGKGIPRDATRARLLVEQSRRLTARQGVNLIQNYVQLKLVDDFAVADLEESMEKASDVQESALQLQIAQGLANRKSKDYNVTEAAQWYQLAADNGQAWGMLSLALLHASGELGQTDFTQAFRWFEKAGEGDQPKHYLGAANLAICLREGIGTAKDEPRAAAIFQKHRNSDFLCYLGSIGQAPRKITTFEEGLALNQSWAKNKNDTHAQFLMAVRYRDGAGVPLDLREAQRWLQKAAKAKNGVALFQLGLMYELQPWTSGYSDAKRAGKAAYDAYRASAETGNIDGLINYGRALQFGLGVAKDEVQAMATYERCLLLEPENARAHSNLGDLYRQKLIQLSATGSSSGTAEWREQMFQHYEISVRLEPSYSAVALGDLYYEGKFIKQDWPKAYLLYEQALDGKFSKAEAHYRLGLMHEHGQSVPITYTEAAYHYRIAALEGNVPALRRLINFYLTGTGVSRDFDRAGYWLSLLVKFNQIDALPMMVDVLIKKTEYDQAIKLLKVLVDFPNSVVAGHAHERLSLFYLTGQGVKKSPKRAERHFQTAIELGNGNALTTLAHRQLKEGKITDAITNLTTAAQTTGKAAYNLGQIYFFGTPLPADRKKALEFFRQAVRLNFGDAHYFLAALCWNNEAEAPSIAEAIELATKAENLGHPKAADLRENLERRLRTQTQRPEENARARSS